MKRLFSLFLILSILLSLSACQEELAESRETLTETSATETVTEATTEEETKALVPEPLTMAKLNSMPIASNAMTIEERRQLCVDFFRLSGLVQYTPSQDFTYKQTSSGNMATIRKGKIYSGLPYVLSGKGNLYTLMHYYDETTGLLDTSKISGQAMGLFIGNQCSYGSLWAWARVVNSFSHTLTNTTHSKNGCIPIAPCQYEYVGDWSKTNLTKTVCTKNGEQTMYEAYANMLPADGMVMYGTGGGHTQMVSYAPVVVRNADGTINGAQSYLKYLDQGSSFSFYYIGDVMTILQTDIDVKLTFEKMYKSGYIPFTFAEFLGTDPVEDGTCEISLTEKTVTSSQLLAASITANYAISDVTIHIEKADGTVIRKTDLPNKIGSKTYQLEELNGVALLHVNASAGDKVSVECRIGNGMLFTVYSGVFA